jgi:hypothetical protein
MSRRRLRRGGPTCAIELRGKVFANMSTKALTCFLGDGSLLEQGEQAVARDDSSAGKFAVEYNIFLPARDIFGDREIMRIEAKPSNTVGVSLGEIHQPAFPTLREDRGFIIDRVGVVAKTIMKRRVQADRVQPFLFPDARLGAMVPPARVERALPYGKRILSPLRLPIPPRGLSALKRNTLGRGDTPDIERGGAAAQLELR